MYRRGLAGALLMGALLAVTTPQAAEVAGVQVDDQTKSGTTELILNGAGLRTKFFFKVYVGALYVSAKSPDAAAIIQSKAPRRVVLHMLRKLDADSLFGALQEGLHKNLNETELAALKPDIDAFERIMRSIGTAKPGDVIGIGIGTDGVAVSMNGSAQGTIADEAFGPALLKVWLGDKPADADLKRGMLGM